MCTPGDGTEWEAATTRNAKQVMNHLEVVVVMAAAAVVRQRLNK